MEIFPRECTGLNSLYTYAKNSGLIETGSSSIDPSLAESCTEVRSLMVNACGIGQINAGLNDVWAALGDPSGVLYFGGRSSSGQRVHTAEYLELLALVYEMLSEQAKADLEKIASSFYAMTQLRPEDCRPVNLDI